MATEIVLDAVDGIGVRWWADTDHGLYVTAGQPLAYASRNRLHYLADAAQLPPGVLEAAEAVHRELVRDADADLRHYITHRRATAFAPLEPIPGRAR